MPDTRPAHQIAYTRLRDMVLFGDLVPGQAVTIEGLVARLGLGMTPVREAIRRLIAEGALALQGNRRVSVPRLTPALLKDLGFARDAIEARLTVMAMDALTAHDTEALRTIDAAIDTAIAQGDVAGYLRANHQFHFTLYAHAGSGVLLDITRSLWLRFGPSLRVVCTAPGQITLPDNHKHALAGMGAGDSAAVVGAIRADIAQGVAQIAAGLDAGAFDAA
ncbi:GntR family transcriptional regulator [Roseicitreum antarcticum]|uniref:Transcriptional regulator, GntR family n=1 Tax=Roseicitreum antarcticum TaxID=564137 RepID=A0A1H3CB10_9RHOB|nr:GntR family transcriptional regulator [Roseicitreum antarcticum]SDX51347.1 transcriptional regulator, GntR family [Roseicitreum antarcticum]